MVFTEVKFFGFLSHCFTNDEKVTF
jgi:hypothetical protein